MSISGTLSNALSGLTAAARSAEVVSSNISNALTEGYGRREVNLSAASLAGTGAGVRIVGINRVVDQALIEDRRLAESGLGQARIRSEFFGDIEKLVGTPDTPGSLGNRISSLESAFIDAATRPDSGPRLQNVVNTARGLTEKFNLISDRVQSLRSDADKAISSAVKSLNTSLENIAQLNREILMQNSAGRDAAALKDQRQQLIDQIAKIVPIREVLRDRGQVALFTEGGAILLEGKPVQVGFTPVGVVVAEMTVASGALSGLTLNGTPVQVLGENATFEGGELAALFSVRDELATAAQENLDTVARDLIERFQAFSVDPSNALGLFTDAGAVFDAANETGIAGRITINALVDPSQGGAAWRLRDGLGATIPGAVGDASTISRLRDAMTASKSPPPSAVFTATGSFAKIASDFLSDIGVNRQTAEAETGFATSLFTALKTSELRSGVDTDQEMQQLLAVEQAYAANARVIQTVDQMIQTLIGL